MWFFSRRWDSHRFRWFICKENCPLLTKLWCISDFDRYHDYSPKSCTRNERLGCITTQHFLFLNFSTAISKHYPKVYTQQRPVDWYSEWVPVVQYFCTTCKLFIASCYGFPGILDMSLLRYKVWEKKIETGKLTKSFKLCSLPPTNSALEQNILWARLTCVVWQAS